MHCGCPRALGFAGQGTAWAGPVLSVLQLHRRFACARLSQPCCRNPVPAFPQRSPPWLLTTAACGGLRSAPDCRPRRALLHLSYSCAPPVWTGDTRDKRPEGDIAASQQANRYERLRWARWHGADLPSLTRAKSNFEQGQGSIGARPGGQITSPCDGWVVYAGVFRNYG
jgi:hypothetical protein